MADSESFLPLLKAYITSGDVKMDSSGENFVFSGRAYHWARSNFSANMKNMGESQTPTLSASVLYEYFPQKTVDSLIAITPDPDKSPQIANKLKNFIVAGDAYLESNGRLIGLAEEASLWMKNQFPTVAVMRPDKKAILPKISLLHAIGEDSYESISRLSLAMRQSNTAQLN